MHIIGLFSPFGGISKNPVENTIGGLACPYNFALWELLLFGISAAILPIDRFKFCQTTLGVWRKKFRNKIRSVGTLLTFCTNAQSLRNTAASEESLLGIHDGVAKEISSGHLEAPGIPRIPRIPRIIGRITFRNGRKSTRFPPDGRICGIRRRIRRRKRAFFPVDSHPAAEEPIGRVHLVAGVAQNSP